MKIYSESAHPLASERLRRIMRDIFLLALGLTLFGGLMGCEVAYWDHDHNNHDGDHHDHGDHRDRDWDHHDRDWDHRDRGGDHHDHR